ncbi:uncharacterized protein SPAPADRAFT_49687 [Spathaspora passalidarum NRRL Y-27907]|uniref:Uncharacterized protein n=1 Tax=Spathaspora passalidarum (strain NRRL Y-27907 / 11-Y1) TaxID=619300 RepID=G3AM28_SPAPN|nr:uncharacterized protein SPAPADRAFT_49687 [Spathaspora passalidarum NRRL Y-27907]EGW32733.1 hypothetical protein SPAPADRAFT_49687 [Spathaspora passalidarum NRRL Y-27907]
MKNIFRKHRSHSSVSSDSCKKQETEQEHHHIHLKSRRYTLPIDIGCPQFKYEVLHSADCAVDSEGEHQDNHETTPSTSRHQQNNGTPTNEGDNQSVALSEADTLMVETGHRLELQETYTDNFTLYLPYLLRQMRIMEQQRMDRLEEILHPAPIESGTFQEYDDDLSTIVSESIAGEAGPAARILNKSLSKFNLKRSFVFAEVMLGSNTFIFPSQKSFQLFKRLRHEVKRERKHSIILYDSKGTIKRISNVKREEVDILEDIIDDRPHIIPLDYKIKGLGLPLLRMQTPVMSAFRKSSPYAIFRRFREIPLPPDPKSTSDKHDDFEFESYVMCKVYSKFFPNFRRLIFEFNIPDVPPFNILMFHSSLRPFADFNYKSTRFRIIGATPTSGLLSSYNPHIRLLVLDDDQESLCDKVINRKQGFELSHIIKKRDTTSSSASSLSFDESIPLSYINPFPVNDLAHEDITDVITQQRRTRYISNNLPPFGECKDSILYKMDEPSLLPKKYSETARLDVYQDNSNLNQDIDSTLSVDVDSLVMACILATIRDISIRNAGKIGNSNIAAMGIAGRMISFGYTGYAFG